MDRQQALEKFPMLENLSTIELIKLANELRKSGDASDKFMHECISALISSSNVVDYLKNKGFYNTVNDIYVKTNGNQSIAVSLLAATNYFNGYKAYIDIAIDRLENESQIIKPEVKKEKDKWEDELCSKICPKEKDNIRQCCLKVCDCESISFVRKTIAEERRKAVIAYDEQLGLKTIFNGMVSIDKNGKEIMCPGREKALESFGIKEN